MLQPGEPEVIDVETSPPSEGKLPEAGSGSGLQLEPPPPPPADAPFAAARQSSEGTLPEAGLSVSVNSESDREDGSSGDEPDSDPDDAYAEAKPRPKAQLRPRHWADVTDDHDDDDLPLDEKGQAWTYVTGAKGRQGAKQGANARIPRTRVLNFLKTFKDKAVYFDPRNAIIHESIADFVATLRAEGSYPQSHFQWPVGSIAFQNAMTVALHHLPPGHYITIKNGRDPPASHFDEKEEYLLDFYHGTTCHALQHGIIRDGLQATLGTGSYDCLETYGVEVPMTYLSRNLETASGYPWNEALETVKIPNHGKTAGGELIANDGTLPMRCVLRCTAAAERRLWFKRAGTNTQDAFLPEDVFISHIMFYAVGANLLNVEQQSYAWEMRNVSKGAVTGTTLQADVTQRLDEIDMDIKAKAESEGKLPEASAAASSSPASKTFAAVVSEGTLPEATTASSTTATKPESEGKLPEASGPLTGTLTVQRLKPHVDDDLVQRSGMAFAIPRVRREEFKPQYHKKQLVQHRLQNRKPLVVSGWMNATKPDPKLGFLKFENLTAQERTSLGTEVPIVELEMLNVHQRLQGPKSKDPVPLKTLVHDQPVEHAYQAKIQDKRKFDSSFKPDTETPPAKAAKTKTGWRPTVPQGKAVPPPPAGLPSVLGGVRPPPPPPPVPKAKEGKAKAAKPQASGKRAAEHQYASKDAYSKAKRARLNPTPGDQLKQYTKWYRIAVACYRPTPFNWYDSWKGSLIPLSQGDRITEETEFPLPTEKRGRPVRMHVTKTVRLKEATPDAVRTILRPAEADKLEAAQVEKFEKNLSFNAVPPPDELTGGSSSSTATEGTLPEGADEKLRNPKLRTEDEIKQIYGPGANLLLKQLLMEDPEASGSELVAAVNQNRALKTVNDIGLNIRGAARRKKEWLKQRPMTDAFQHDPAATVPPSLQGAFDAQGNQLDLTTMEDESEDEGLKKTHLVERVRPGATTKSGVELPKPLALVGKLFGKKGAKGKGKGFKMAPPDVPGSAMIPPPASLTDSADTTQSKAAGAPASAAAPASEGTLPEAAGSATPKPMAAAPAFVSAKAVMPGVGGSLPGLPHDTGSVGAATTASSSSAPGPSEAPSEGILPEAGVVAEAEDSGSDTPVASDPYTGAKLTQVELEADAYMSADEGGDEQAIEDDMKVERSLGMRPASEFESAISGNPELFEFLLKLSDDLTQAALKMMRKGCRVLLDEDDKTIIGLERNGTTILIKSNDEASLRERANIALEKAKEKEATATPAAAASSSGTVFV